MTTTVGFLPAAVSGPIAATETNLRLPCDVPYRLWLAFHNVGLTPRNARLIVIAPGDLYKHAATRQAPPGVAPSNRPQLERPSQRARTSDDPVVLDDLPELVPITTAELDTIQFYLGDLIDRLIADAAASTETKSVSVPKARKQAGIPPPRS
ncbi:hypothetical protein [Bradyrhizobium cytisi]|uniref:Uncharacterized protein n=1 Tax=Bradyrhizobium cytisi TaxID=515489 RepID=A0A5S4WWW0_9BRAD|nr:hypothetical protein FXB38_08705 [Bradyrhizobium cytisi]